MNALLSSEQGSHFSSFLNEPLKKLGALSAHQYIMYKRLGIQTVRDLLWHLPTGLRTFPQKPLKLCRVGDRVCLRVRIIQVQTTPKATRLMAESVEGGPHGIQIVFLKGEKAKWRHIFIPQSTWFFWGEISSFDSHLSMVHPERWFSERETPPPDHELIYPLTTGLALWMIQRLIKQATRSLPEAPEWHAENFLKKRMWPSFKQALIQCHTPEAVTLDPLNPARERLAFDSFLAHQISLMLSRKLREQQKTHPLPGDGQLQTHFLNRCGFSLTQAQENAWREIQHDLSCAYPMARLLQGDVGSGKTIVAFLALAQAVESGAQGVFVAPTEVLAAQQASKLTQLLEGTPWRCCLLTRTTPLKKRLLEDINAGRIHFIVGTHALFEEKVTFAKLGMAVVDEQHRFGVEQRLRLVQKSLLEPHLLIMSATPIPRTFEMTRFGDLNISLIQDKPQGRLDIETRVICHDKLEELERFVGDKIASGAQIYWICPLIDGGEEGEKEAADSSLLTRFDRLNTLFPGQVGAIHGRMKSAEKQKALDDFSTGQIPLLIATTVIEVGVDVPQATLIVIEEATQFGLAQLHQLRGRVGRGTDKSLCILLYKKPLSPLSQKRLEAIRSTNDGFVLAEQDWRLRGGGDRAGIRQSGALSLPFVDWEHHLPLLTEAHQMARRLVDQPSHAPEIPGEFQMLLRIFGYNPQRNLLQAG